MILPKPGKYHFRAMRLRVAYPWGKGFLRPEVNTPKFDILNSFDSFTFHIILWKVNTTIRQSWIISCKSVTFFFQSRDEQYQERKIIQPLLRWVAHIFLNLWYEIKGSQRLLIFEFLSRRNVRAMVTAQFVRFLVWIAVLQSECCRAIFSWVFPNCDGPRFCMFFQLRRRHPTKPPACDKIISTRLPQSGFLFGLRRRNPKRNEWDKGAAISPRFGRKDP